MAKAIGFDCNAKLKDPDEPNSNEAAHYFRVLEKNGKILSPRMFCSLCWENSIGFS